MNQKDIIAISIGILLRIMRIIQTTFIILESTKCVLECIQLCPPLSACDCVSLKDLIQNIKTVTKIL